MFLPICAAGFYDMQHSQPGHKIYDFVASSYVPTLSILASSLELDPAGSGNLSPLAVAQPLSDGQSKPPGVVTEMEYVRSVIRNTPSAGITLVESTVGTVEEVLSLMKSSDWARFVCHGVRDPEKLPESGLCLADQRQRKLSDMISLSHPCGERAFLSACQMAEGDEALSDKAIHVAAGMLFAGYGGIVGTMWSISDRFAPYVTRDVYEQLFRDSMRLDCREAARALHVVVEHLRDNRARFENWIPFIHVDL